MSPNSACEWKSLSPTLEVLSDKYAYRYVESLPNKVVAFRYYLRSFTFSRTVVFWHKNYASPEDALKAAKYWLIRYEELERAPSDEGEAYKYNLALNLFLEPSPETLREAW